VVFASGIAGLVAGAMSMAAGEYVSVQSQADTERSDIAKETRELAEDPDSELAELTNIYVRRGLQPSLARAVAEQLTAHDALGSHARDELGITETLRARPVQAALASAAAFTVGALAPIATVLLAPPARVQVATVAMTLVALSLSGALAARIGGANPWRGGARVVFWGALAMAAASLVGRLFHVQA
jgi:VIT1/CCC1 family predicted Fe2+/Mn2+ transporter